jgi:serine protease Do
MQVDAVRDGKPGEKAGIKAKDVIVSFAGQSIGSMGDYMKALQTLKPGDKAEVTVLREGELVKLNVQF